MAQFELGVNDQGEFLLPKSAISTQKISLFLRDVTREATVSYGDQLLIPYCAIAADIEDGRIVVIK